MRPILMAAALVALTLSAAGVSSETAQAPSVRDLNREILLAALGSDYAAQDLVTVSGTELAPASLPAVDALELRLDFLDRNGIELELVDGLALAAWPMQGHLMVTEGARLPEGHPHRGKFCDVWFPSNIQPAAGQTTVHKSTIPHPRPNPANPATQTTYTVVVGQAKSFVAVYSPAGAPAAVQHYPAGDARLEGTAPDATLEYTEDIVFGPQFDYWCSENRDPNSRGFGRVDLNVFVIGEVKPDPSTQ